MKQLDLNPIKDWIENGKTRHLVFPVFETDLDCLEQLEGLPITYRKDKAPEMYYMLDVYFIELTRVNSHSYA